MPYTSAELFQFQLANMISSGLTLIGASVMGTCILYHKPWLKDSRNDEKILFSMCVVSLFGAFAMVQNQQVLTDPFMCQVQASLIEFAVMALPMFNLAQAVNFWYILSEGRTPHHYVWAYMGLCLLVPLIFTVYALQVKAFGNAIIWCWIVKARNDLRYILFFGPLWICIFFSILFTGFGVRKVFTIEKQNMVHNYHHTRTASKAFLYGLVFVISWLPGTTNRLYEAVIGTSPIFLVVLHCFFTPIQGFLNACVFFYLRSVKSQSQEKHRQSVRQSVSMTKRESKLPSALHISPVAHSHNELVTSAITAAEDDPVLGHVPAAEYDIPSGYIHNQPSDVEYNNQQQQENIQYEQQHFEEEQYEEFQQGDFEQGP